jgi:hypothetical protein
VSGRWLFAAGFVALVVGLIVLRDHGYLGGRELGGPLELTAPDAARAVDRGETVRFRVKTSLSVSEVRVQNVRARIRSPELAVAKSVAGHPLENAVLERPVEPIFIALRARRPGLYYAIGLILDYRRGERRFRDREAQVLCIAVQTRQRCDLDYQGPGDARVAQVGGPSRYRGAVFAEQEARYGAPGEHRIRLTISNRTGVPIDVARLSLDANAPGVALALAQPAAFELGPHEHRLVRLTVRMPACGDVRFGRLRAQLDGDKRSIPLSLPLRFGCAA